MGSTNPSFLRQAILGEAASYEEEEHAPVPGTDKAPATDRPREAEAIAPALRSPLVPMSRSGAGHTGHMKLLFENAPVAMAMFDTEMRYLLANRRWLEDFKLTSIDVAGRSQYELF